MQSLMGSSSPAKHTNALAWRLLVLLPPLKRVRQRAAIHVLELASQRYAMRDPGQGNTVLATHLGDVLGSGLALDSRVRGENDFLHLALRQTRIELVQSQLTRSDPIQGRQTPLEHKVQALIGGGLL